MSELRYNNITATLTSAGLSSSASVAAFTSAPGFPSIGSSDYVKMTALDTGEIMYLSPYTAGSASVTISARGQEGTTAAAHGPGLIPTNLPTPDYVMGYVDGNWPSFSAISNKYPTSVHVPISAIPNSATAYLASGCDGEKGDYSPEQAATFTVTATYSMPDGSVPESVVY